jgi:phosphoserine phosphatase
VSDRSPRRTLLVTLTGDDRPGLTCALFADLATGHAADPPGPEILDVEQVVVRGQLILGILLAVGPDSASVADRVIRSAGRLGLRCQVAAGTGDERSRVGSGLHVTVVGRPLLPAALHSVTARLAERGANIDRIRRMSVEPVTSLELDVSGVPDLVDLRRDLATAAVGAGVDVAVSPAGLARHGRRLVVLDVDSTLIQDEAIELLAAAAGRAEEVAAVTERAMRGEIDFAESLHERVSTLAGLGTDVLRDVRDRVRLTPGARTLVRTLRRLGFTLALVSGGFHEIVDPLAEGLGIRHVRANRLEVAEGRLTGRISGRVMDRAGKAEALCEFAAAEDLPLDRTVAVGDGANDLDMLAVAGLGIAFNAKPVVREQADASVTVPYLDTVLLILGLTREEFDVDPEDAGPATAVAGPAPPAPGGVNARVATPVTA